MATGALLMANDAIVAMDYGQFSLYGSRDDDGDYMQALEAALAGEGVAGNGRFVLVLPRIRTIRDALSCRGLGRTTAR